MKNKCKTNEKVLLDPLFYNGNDKKNHQSILIKLCSDSALYNVKVVRVLIILVTRVQYVFTNI